MTKLLHSLPFFLCTCFLFAQQKELQGYILNETEVEGIHILNVSSNQKTITDGLGRFTINAALHDTLMISSIKYMPTKIEISSHMYLEGKIEITLNELVNELDEVLLGRTLTGDFEKDVKDIETQAKLNFYDVGLPGFRGEPEEKIPRVLGQVIAPTAVNIEGLYKHLSGYYKKLKIKRKWEGQNATIENIMAHYSPVFFKESYGMPEEMVSDFLQFCIETTDLQSDFNIQNHAGVMTIFQQNAPRYVARLEKE